MSSASHTPGPWVAGWGTGVTGPRGAYAPYMPLENEKPVFTRIPIRRGNQPVAWVISVDEPLAQLEADARLIAAAPDLLASVRELLADHQLMEPHHHDLCDLCKRANTAINKARPQP